MAPADHESERAGVAAETVLADRFWSRLEWSQTVEQCHRCWQVLKSMKSSAGSLMLPLSAAALVLCEEASKLSSCGSRGLLYDQQE